ncbi:parB-like partition protein [Acidimicrobium ferrooxidans DSM 10331]|uniref:ParB-like partition protein n=1 Tax=Acidimicrobium ferrooxidans (strain DSM 10331 / JCM 15462 / NBRC 103882 / ICP) TaxID=525909 RepID=C7M2E2_ACIFD|nr:ParB/RepB/Spo0J family partition protein [Acidimicrobium ferrooxidans]ACU54931.1 parB-like partition protein [Acidimicrobium ferrooxidans DSM 10331]
MARQTGLGRGLGALIPTGVQQEQHGLVEIPVGAIRPNPLQPRTIFDEEALSGLAASIAEVGVLQPILVRRVADGYELIAGERRWRAAQRAGLDRIPAIVQDRDDRGSLQVAVIENLHRRDLNPLEEAAAYRQLIDDFQLTHDEVARGVGKSRAAVSNTLRLLQLPAALQRMLLDGVLSAGHARALLGCPDRRLQEELARRTVEEGLSVRDVEEAVRAISNPAAEATRVEAGESEHAQGPKEAVPEARLRPAIVVELERLLADVMESDVQIDVSKSGAGYIRVRFVDLADLHRIASGIVDPHPQVEA